MNIENLGKGCIPTPPEISKTKFKLAKFAVPIIDWNVSYRVPVDLKTKFQDGSSSCTAQATTYYLEALNYLDDHEDEQFSPRFIYSQSSLGYGQGTYIWKAMSIPLTKGITPEKFVPSEDSSEKIMLDTSLNAEAFITDRAIKYAQIPRTDIDSLAQIIKDYRGFVTGFNGYDGMFGPDGTVLRWDKSDWGHGVYVCGYKLHNGKKCLIFKNSWGNWGDNSFGYFPEEFVNSGMMYDAYVYASIQDLDPTSMENRLIKTFG
jgi:hypothetical protein